MKNTLLLLLFCGTATLTHAQFIKEKSVAVQVGYGMSVPENSVDSVVDSGFYAQGELILQAASWVSFRPYVGFIITNSDGKDIDGDPTDEVGETKAALLGGKVRLLAPIPWIAPYIELGIGTSIGTFKTLTAEDNFDKSGFIYHIPFSLGLELGKDHNVDLGLTYYFQPSVQQYAGALDVGIEFPLDTL